MSPAARTAQTASLVSCTVCHLLMRMRPAASAPAGKCPRCGAALHSRKPNSIARTWALVIAAFVLYVPAMCCPSPK